ncbi:MAG TPA: hypothetical protein PLG50_16215 [bacterium]|nr:hypothetical protein [bacterium]HQG47204.1 hypothetical protein [bacterium]HQI49042.1 hypothetical protein [bacterium]HQJ65062.1 hypothetical protein [bacterium]
MDFKQQPFWVFFNNAVPLPRCSRERSAPGEQLDEKEKAGCMRKMSHIYQELHHRAASGQQLRDSVSVPNNISKPGQNSNAFRTVPTFSPY